MKVREIITVGELMITLLIDMNVAQDQRRQTFKVKTWLKKYTY